MAMDRKPYGHDVGMVVDCSRTILSSRRENMMGRGLAKILLGNQPREVRRHICVIIQSMRASALQGFEDLGLWCELQSVLC